MTDTSSGPKVHLVGSVPLNTAEEVFTQVSAAVGEHLCRLPDGETGSRKGWIAQIQRRLADHPNMEPDDSIPPFQFKQWDGKVVREYLLIRLTDGTDADSVTFDAGYADDAIASYAEFEKMQAAGKIPAGVRFQVSLPSPLAPTYNYCSPAHRLNFLRIFEKSLLADLDRIAAAIPHEKLAIQWDICQEVLVFEDYYLARPDDYKQEAFEQFGRIGDAVPADIEVGYHLCYGSPMDEHVIQPKDAAILAELTQGIVDHVKRPVQFIHIPVPKDRTDDAYYQPLDALNLPAVTDFYLGLVHDGDDDGNRTRLGLAQAHCRVDGVATECGWGRGAPERVPGILSAHANTIGYFS